MPENFLRIPANQGTGRRPVALELPRKKRVCAPVPQCGPVLGSFSFRSAVVPLLAEYSDRECRQVG